ncbi:imidazole glycerol phosphate synthase subunit HisF [Pedobacter heparinus]|uniref:Histidine biosynthesis protein n=1 Tax=Pedobacter heparinus (strain ATCC 13125 / DSM 2366 / CIP 104194 / JCM 7457 / NBRC 12017 / NCIMB 9290 / NRRL B-14731 / HIM 762-3) TaxID=485917 RepID=C6XVQ0_PEDHD|nr:HisA/HisF-related TIM barrel protein [Pedobacter heparinus]ACU06125.1 histidine biosynthesis protein [Pedobacter heparinus DSM 2366]
MLKKRVAANLVVKDGIVVQSIGFKKYLPVGKPEIAIEFLNQWGIDEIILTDISATRKQSGPDFDMIRRAAQKCFVPLTVGGGISNTGQMKELLHNGADKISLNNAAITTPELITETAHIFGGQCVVISIDGIHTNKGFRIYDYLTHSALDISPSEFAKRAEDSGAGEILINSVDRDGSYLGFDHELINSVCSVVNIPVIVCGGAKNAGDFIEVFSKTNASAATAANFFHFSEHSVNITKSILNKKMDVRSEAFANYEDACFDDDQRLLKKEDEVLENLLFIRIEKEII